MNKRELKELFKNTFNTVADGYDSSAMRFFPESAERISSYLHLNGDEQVLDIATGTGGVALAIAKDLPRGQVTGIDFSEGMLSRAMKKRDEKGIRNVTFSEMDMQSIDFPNRHFDVAVCAFGIFFVEDMKEQLIHFAEKVKKDGKIIITTFFRNAFSPLVDIFLGRLEKYGVQLPPLAWKRVATKEQCESLFNEVGLYNIKCEERECGYYLSDASDWWYIIWNGGFRRFVTQLSDKDLAKFKEEHLTEISQLATEKGIWLEMGILYTIGTKKE